MAMKSRGAVKSRLSGNDVDREGGKGVNETKARAAEREREKGYTYPHGGKLRGTGGTERGEVP